MEIRRRDSEEENNLKRVQSLALSSWTNYLVPELCSSYICIASALLLDAERVACIEYRE